MLLILRSSIVQTTFLWRRKCFASVLTTYRPLMIRDSQALEILFLQLRKWNFWDRVSFSPAWPWTRYVSEDDLELRNPLTSISPSSPVWPRCECVNRWVKVRPDVDIRCLPLVFETGLSLNLRFHRLARLGGSPDFLTLPPCSEITGVLPCPALYVGIGDLNSDLSCLYNK